MNELQTRSAIEARANRKIKQNKRPPDLKKPELAKHNIKGKDNGSSRHPPKV